MNVDVVIVGAGPAGIFAALELARNSDLQIVVCERGKSLDRREEAIRQHEREAWTSGWGGAGAFSDGKLTLSPEVGGWLGDFVGERRLAELIDDVDRVWREHGAPDEVAAMEPGEGRELSERAALAGLSYVPQRIRHIGSDNTPQVLSAFFAELENRVQVLFGRRVLELIVRDGRCVGVTTDDGEILARRAVILAPGRQGSSWLQQQAKSAGLGYRNNAVDIGVRVEVPAAVAAPLTDHAHEAKLIYHSRRFDNRVRTFCMNPYGEVVTEHYDGLLTVNGHSYKRRKTEATNFAILVSTAFTEPFDDPIGYGRAIATLANLLAGGVMVQRWVDLQRGRRSTPERIARSLVAPTLTEATPGDLSFVLPYRHLANIMEMLEALDQLCPGMTGPGTLLYGVEVKFYSVRFDLDEQLRSAIDGLYIVGDGAGVSRGLVQSSASGLVAARSILSA
ncbi:MAG: FAD-dependent oxidoreductase [Candidatus Alcyoniella australis]|nr:FAD-dependent oxidoreductase [Candidatus Alcyoniella australis]